MAWEEKGGPTSTPLGRRVLTLTKPILLARHHHHHHQSLLLFQEVNLFFWRTTLERRGHWHGAMLRGEMEAMGKLSIRQKETWKARWHPV